ncbi:MAG TPA: YciI family protein [Rhizomicrobium sp.]|nr:YciI family protein [Rhizomicrobium sp.]
MLFAITSLDKPGAQDLRMATREKHLAYGARVGNLRLGGPFLDEAGNMVGSFVVLEADSLEAAQDWANNDPYFLAGLFASVDVRPWKMTINKCGAQF